MKGKTNKGFILPLVYASIGLVAWALYSLIQFGSLGLGGLPIDLCFFVLPILAFVVSKHSSSSGIKIGIKILCLVIAVSLLVLAVLHYVQFTRTLHVPKVFFYSLPGSTVFSDLYITIRGNNILGALYFLSGMAYIMACATCFFVDATERKYIRLYKIGRVGLFSLCFGAILAFFISVISLLVYDKVYIFDGYDYTRVLWLIVIAASTFGILGLPMFFCGKSSYKANKQKQKHIKAAGDGYIDLGKHIVLCIFTFGIWYLIWIYRTTAYLNQAPETEHYKPASKLLLCMFVPFYSIFWFYKHGQRIDTLSKSRNVQGSDMATLCLILGIFIPVVACILMQDRINTIVKSQNNGSISINKENAGSIEQLKQFKELLDNGTITQEEFNIKKKQLLGL